MSFPALPWTNGNVATVNNISYTYSSAKGVWLKSIGGIPTTSTISSLTINNTITVNTVNGVTAIANGGTTGVGNIGTSGSTFNTVFVNTVFAKATTAQNADLAENYIADNNYDPGTVVEFGGEFEVTESNLNSTRVAGIVSTNPAYLMNSEATGNFILPIAIAGRVPCKVVGPVQKGDLLVASDNGYAIASADPSVGSVVGKALENLEDSVGTIEVVVGRC